MTKKALITLTVTVLICGLLATSILADSQMSRVRAFSDRPETVNNFNINPDVNLEPEKPFIGESPWGATPSRRPLGATSVNVGEGKGESVGLTFDERQATWTGGRQTAHYYNGLTGLDAKVSVHFVYSLALDTSTHQYGASVTDLRNYPETQLTGYNVYDATMAPAGDWPVGGQDIGCGYQETDTAGLGYTQMLGMTHDGRAVTAAMIRTALFAPEVPPDPAEYLGRVIDTRVYYQGTEFNCAYNPYEPINVSWPDSTFYRDSFITPADPADARDNIYLVYPSVATQFDGSHTIVHIAATENAGLTVPGYGAGLYSALLYFRKVGDYSGDGAWEELQVLDTIDWITVELTADEFPREGVACIYYNPTENSMIQNTPEHDIFCIESSNRGVTWGTSYSITNYNNSSEDLTKHYSAQYEAHGMYDSQGDLHAWWIAIHCSAAPFDDGFNWNDWDCDLYHWEKSSDAIVKVANGTFLQPDMLGGSINPANCGYGGGNSGYVAWATMGECDGKLYMVWSQMHERANRFPWRDVVPQPAAGVLDDCAAADISNLYARANWEILMSVARRETSSLWDYPRNISDTYRPGCGLPGDVEHPTPCASEWHPQMEQFALDASVEAGLDLYWPEASKVDMTPDGFPPYSGDWWLNMAYMDDQWPGPSWWGGDEAEPRWNAPPTLNSIKWLRLACVEPIEASRIATNPAEIEWPEWVKAGTTEPQEIIVINEGNVLLNVSQIGAVATAPAGSWLTITAADPFTVTAGINHTNTFDVNIDASGIAEPTWLEGYVWLKSDAVNSDSLVIPIRVLAADTVEPAYWDTVMTHDRMFHPLLAPTGACVALALGNMGELGYGARSVGRVGLDYREASTGAMDPTHAECDTTISKNGVYLVSATPFVVLADAGDGTGAELTTSFNDEDQAETAGFDPTPDKGSLTGGLTAGGAYDSAYSGRFVNRDTTIAMERIVYGPRSANPAADIINFMIVYTKVYSADGNPHNHLTVGNVADYDITSDAYNHNLGGLVPGSFVYMQGTDAVANTSCQTNVGRYATEVFGGGYTSAEWLADNCFNDVTYKGASVIEQLIMVDTNLWGAVPVDPPEPNPLTFWNTAGQGGLSVVSPMPDTGRDLATFLTYKHDYNLGATDTLHYWTVMTTTPIHTGLTGLVALTQQITYAKSWYMETVRGCESISCCEERVGDANSLGTYPDEISLGDIMLMVDVLFISNDCTKIACPEEADVNQSGGANPVQAECLNYLSLGDIMTLVDFLFITGPQTAVLNTCL